jgi:hypothetical protein
VKDTGEKLSSVDWERVTEEMNVKGYAIIPDAVVGRLTNNILSFTKMRKKIKFITAGFIRSCLQMAKSLSLAV